MASGVYISTKHENDIDCQYYSTDFLLFLLCISIFSCSHLNQSHTYQIQFEYIEKINNTFYHYRRNFFRK